MFDQQQETRSTALGTCCASCAPNLPCPAGLCLLLTLEASRCPVAPPLHVRQAVFFLLLHTVPIAIVFASLVRRTCRTD